MLKPSMLCLIYLCNICNHGWRDGSAEAQWEVEQLFNSELQENSPEEPCLVPDPFISALAHDEFQVFLV